MNKHEHRKLVLGCYGLTEPKDLPEECKKCSNFYCTFCFKCRYLTKKNTDYDCYIPNEQETENYKAYEKFCDAVVREYIDIEVPIFSDYSLLALYRGHIVPPKPTLHIDHL